MARVILISPPYMKISRPTYDIPLALKKGVPFMNPALLISSSILKENEISNKIVKIFDISDEEVISSIDEDTCLVGISVTCAWEYLEALKIAEIVKEKCSNKIKVLLGGWQIKSIKEKVFEDSQYIDYAVIGDSEYSICEIYKSVLEGKDIDVSSVYKKNKVYNTNIEAVSFRVIDFSQFPDYKKYMPYVEESRNCPVSCRVCLNSCVKDRYQCVPYDIFVKNVDNVSLLYGGDCEAHLLAANFGVNYKETIKKLEYLSAKNMRWNIELHVDNPWDKYIHLLPGAGISKVSIGFESGSKTILRYMNKTVDPNRYLERLSVLMSKLNEQGIKPSLNLLFDYRETKETIQESIRYLKANQEKIKKIKTNFMFAFDGLLDKIDYSYNPNIIVDDYGKSIHAYPLLPSFLNLQEVYYIMDELEHGNYDENLLSKF